MGVGGHAPSYGVHIFFDWTLSIFIQLVAITRGHGIANLNFFFIRKPHYLGYGMADLFLRFGGGVEHRFRPDMVWDSMPLAPVESDRGEQRENCDNNPAFHKYSRRASRFLPYK